MMYSNLAPLRNLAMIIFLFMSFFEQPSWCTTGDCGAPDDTLLSGLPIFSRWLFVSLEYSCILIFVSEMMVQAMFTGCRAFLQDKWHSLQIFVLAIHIVELTLFASQIFPAGRLPIMKPIFFLIRKKNVRNVAIGVCKTIQAVLRIFMVYLFLIIWFAGIGVVLFDGKEKSIYFRNVPVAMLNLLICMTTANFPDGIVTDNI